MAITPTEMEASAILKTGLKNSNSSYPQYRVLTLQAAKTLFAGSCTEFNTVKAAWNAVAVPAQRGEPTCSA